MEQGNYIYIYILEEKLKVLGIGRDKLFSILRANHLLIIPKRQYHITTDSHHRFRKHKNKIETISINRPEQVWVSDITYIGNRTNPVYLALITDAYSKKIVGHNVSDNLATTGSLLALKHAIKERDYEDKELIHHSDRGFQYCSGDYQKVLRQATIACSMTESYDPYANAVAERVNGILKQDFLFEIKGLDIETIKQVVKERIEIYNNRRPHESCNMLTPIQMHDQSKIKTYKMKKSSKNVFAAL